VAFTGGGVSLANPAIPSNSVVSRAFNSAVLTARDNIRKSSTDGETFTDADTDGPVI
jgi:hypothetical protein